MPQRAAEHHDASRKLRPVSLRGDRDWCFRGDDYGRSNFHRVVRLITHDGRDRRASATLPRGDAATELVDQLEHIVDDVFVSGPKRYPDPLRGEIHATSAPTRDLGERLAEYRRSAEGIASDERDRIEANRRNGRAQ